ncbi:MAG: UDP-3-O-(3-hydroxymyristoyl)glucosamine N-acyltransferase [Paludibacteraceae bacterium]|nr:UDP-3-O-(3-hydroxymyristoyl)glucosamine N-acyltransferase [Paludibacteraceae bacterium]MBR1480683.1 UDP-3-O-(3-hydroxymyristoyl)glucosamine N-acyltransferase [Paludibacteraceae bacterium]
MQFTAQQIAGILGGTLSGDPARAVSDVAPIESAEPHQLSYVTDEKYLPLLRTTRAGVVLVSQSLAPQPADMPDLCPTLVLVENARGAMAQLLTAVAEVLNPRKRGVEQPCYISEGVEVPEDAYIGAFAYIGRGVRLGRGVQIYPQSYIGDYAVIGDNTLIYPGVRVYHHCQVGRDCILHSGVVIGADGFGFEPDAQGVNRKVPQIGAVIIEDDVEIGANTTIDRAMMGNTVVRRNAKLDNLVQVAHNVQVGESTFLCAQVGIAGSSTVGSHCVLAGQVGVAGHISIADNSVFGAQSGVAGSVRRAGSYMGYPAIDAARWRRSVVGFKNLPEMMTQLNKLDKQQ